MPNARILTILTLLLDVLCVFVVFNLVIRVRGIPEAMDLWITTPLFPPAGLMVFAVYLIQGYRLRTDMLSVDYASQHTIALVGAMLATLLLTFVFRVGYELQSSRAVIAFSFLALTPLSLGYRRLIYVRAAASRGSRSLVFFGDRTSCESFHAECQKMEMTQPVIYCMVGEHGSSAEIGQGIIDVRTFEQVLADVKNDRIGVEAIVLRESSRELSAHLSRELVQLYFSGVPTYTLELFHQVYWQKIPIYRLNQTWLFQEGFQIAREPVFERIKRVTDVFLALVGLVLASPLIILSAIAIRLEDRGSVFFAQTRIGKNHVPFRLLKLRTMKASAESVPSTESLYTQPGDSRITKVGRLLRSTRIDEFPQLWNVLRGDMSLIGPRAEWDRLVERYEQEIPCYHFRHLVKPGITGWAQVNYPYGANIEDTIRKLEYDLHYIRHFSFLLDATIVLKTVHIMIFGKGR